MILASLKISRKNVQVLEKPLVSRFEDVVSEIEFLFLIHTLTRFILEGLLLDPMGLNFFTTRMSPLTMKIKNPDPSTSQPLVGKGKEIIIEPPPN